jgi:phage tail-like protein
VSARGSDPYRANHFCVSCKALPALGFTEVRGLSVDATVETETASRSAQDETSTDCRPVAAAMAASAPEQRATDSPKLELSRGVTADQPLWTWFHDWLAGKVTPQDVRICLLDDQGAPVMGWMCRAAIPVRWVGPTLVADRATVAMETLELVHRGIDRIVDLEMCCDRVASDESETNGGRP